MFEFYVIVFWPHVGGLVLGLLLALISRRSGTRRADRLTRALAIVGSGIALVVAIAPTVLGIVQLQTELEIPSILWANFDSPLHYSAPLVAGVLAVALMLCAPMPRSDSAGADLTPRSLRSFTNLGSLAAMSVLAAATVAIALAAGSISTTNDDGQYRMYVIDSGPVSGGTEIYGWYYSIPALLALALLLVLTAVTLWKITHPSLSNDAAFDTAVRRGRSRVVIGSAIASLILHLGYVGVFLAGTASLKVGGQGGVGGDWVRAWTEFAALEPALRTTGLILQLAGIAVWAYLFFRAARGERTLRD